MDGRRGKMIQPAVCDICGGGTFHLRVSLRFEGARDPFTLWRCDECGVLMHWPRLESEQLRDQYDSDYYIFKEPPLRRWSRTAQLYLEHLHPWEARTQGRRLLDVGCACGELLALARERGWDAQGIELSPHAAAVARKRFGLPVSAGTLEEQDGRLGIFDVVIATDVIEHVPSPRRFVQSIRSRLNPDGVAILETPNWGSPWRRFGGRRWLGYNPFHIFLFNQPALAHLMRSCGFDSCVFTTSTHVAHRRWGDRPEWAGILDWLPAGARWRCQRWLNHVSSRRSGEAFPCEPPASLDEALQCIERAGESPFPRRGFLNNDNLAVIARRP